MMAAAVFSSAHILAALVIGAALGWSLARMMPYDRSAHKRAKADARAALAYEELALVLRKHPRYDHDLTRGPQGGSSRRR